MKNVYRKVPKNVIPEEIVIKVFWCVDEKHNVIYDTDEMTRAFEEALAHLPKRKR